MRENPTDPAVPEIEALTAADKRSYLQHGRDCLSWAVYVFRKP